MEELDYSIIQQAARGDEKAFKRLYDRYAPFIWKVVFRTSGGDNGMSREIMQDTFVKVFRSLKKFSNESAFSTWLFRIAYNSAMAHLGKRARLNGNTVEFSDQKAGTCRSDGYENREMASRILNSLSPKDRFLLTAREIDDFAFEEIALITGKTAGALRTRLHRLKEEIRNNYRTETCYGNETYA